MAKIIIRNRKISEIFGILADALEEDKEISGHISVYETGCKKVLDFCYVCGKPVLEGQKTVCRGTLMHERLIHLSCTTKSKEHGGE